MEHAVAHVRSMDHSVVMPFAKHFPERTNRLRRSKKVYKHRGFRHRHTSDSQGWQGCVVMPLAKHLAGKTGKVEKVKAGFVRRQGTEEGRTKAR
jgi:hypothetical protein